MLPIFFQNTNHCALKIDKYMNKINSKLNKQAWNFVAEKYKGGSALPSWGTCGEGATTNVLGNVKGKTILEIGCGSGDSIIYLLKQGAKHVVGIDFSERQIELAHERIAQAFKNDPKFLKRVTLINQSMEEKLPNGTFDYVIAIYSVGWAENIATLFQKIHQKLKPSAEFCFSWDHYMSRIVDVEKSMVVVKDSYHEPKKLVRKDWKSSGVTIKTHQLKPSDWFEMLTTSGFSVTGFWEPKPDREYKVLDVCSEVYSPEITAKVPSCVIFKAKKDK